MAGKRSIPNSRKRLPGKPPHGASPEVAVSVRVQNTLATAAARTRMARIKREAQALREPFRKPRLPAATSATATITPRGEVDRLNTARGRDPRSSNPATITGTPPPGPAPIDWAKVGDEVAANPNPKQWSAKLVAQLRTLRPPNLPRSSRFRRHLQTSNGRRIHINVP